MRTRVIGLGNSILTDDGVGIYAARELSRRLVAAGLQHEVDIVESEVGGFALMELMIGWDRVFLIDSVQFQGLEPGTVIQIDPRDLHTSLRLKSVHDVDFPTVLELGKRLDLYMPAVIKIFGIQAKEVFDFGEGLSAAVQRGMLKAVEIVFSELDPKKN